MKTIIVALIASCVVSLAQTNTYNSDSTLDNNAPLDTTRKLLDAAKSGDVKTVKLLLEKGADVNTKSDDGGTALMSAAKRGYMEIIKLLLDKGADINAKDTDGTTALMLAAVKGQTKVVQLLLDKGADINAQRNDGRGALMLAEETDQTQTAELLLEKDLGGINAALSYAAYQGDTNGVVLLLDKGADVNAKDNYGATLLMRVAMTGHTNTVELLLDKGANVNAKDNFGKTALMSAARIGNVETIKLLLDKGANVNAKDDLGETALMSAAESGDTNAVAILLARGADINAVDADGLTALGLVGIEKEFGYAAIEQLLKKSGATALSASGSSFNAVVASGTNTDSSGYVTNEALLTPFTLTSSTGRIITNAVLIKLTPNKFVYKTPSGEMGMLRLDSLPKDLQDKCGYNPQIAQAADAVENQKKARLQELAQQQRESAKQQAQWDAAVKKALAKKTQFYCDVIQKIDAGLLVSSPGSYSTEVSSVILLVKDYPRYDSVAAQDQIFVSAFPIGLYSYTTVNHSENTVHVWTCSTNVAVEYYLTH